MITEEIPVDLSCCPIIVFTSLISFCSAGCYRDLVGEGAHV